MRADAKQSVYDLICCWAVLTKHAVL